MQLNVESVGEHAQRLWEENVVMDMVCPLDMPGLEPAGCPAECLFDYKSAGVSFTAIDIGEDELNAFDALNNVKWARRFIADHPYDFILAETINDVLRAKRENKLAIGLQSHGTGWFGKDYGLIEPFHRLGLRVVQLVFNAGNYVGGGCSDIVDGGLTKFGRSVIAELERLGICVDLSHTGYKTTMDAMELVTKPPVFSHACIHAVNDHYRNVRDDQLKALAALDGVVGVSGNSGYLGDDSGSMETVFKHIDHAVQLVGPRHVGFGLDFVFDVEVLNDWVRRHSDDWPDAKDPNWAGFRFERPKNLTRLVQLMVDAGYSDESIIAIMSGNFIRICEANWSTEA